MPDEGNATIADEDRLYTNGIDGGTGQHLWQPVAIGETAASIKAERQEPIQNANSTSGVSGYAGVLAPAIPGFEVNFDRPGMDYPDFDTESAQSCRAGASKTFAAKPSRFGKHLIRVIQMRRGSTACIGALMVEEWHSA